MNLSTVSICVTHSTMFFLVSHIKSKRMLCFVHFLLTLNVFTENKKANHLKIFRMAQKDQKIKNQRNLRFSYTTTLHNYKTNSFNNFKISFKIQFKHH